MEVCGDGIETTSSSAYKDQKTAEGWKTKTYHKGVTNIGLKLYVYSHHLNSMAHIICTKICVPNQNNFYV